MGVVGRKASSDGRRKLRHQVVGRWRRFRAIAGKGEDKRVNEADLTSMAPGFVGKPGHGDGAPQSAVESSAAEGDAETQVAPQVPH